MDTIITILYVSIKYNGDYRFYLFSYNMRKICASNMPVLERFSQVWNLVCIF